MFFKMSMDFFWEVLKKRDLGRSPFSLARQPAGRVEIPFKGVRRGDFQPLNTAAIRIHQKDRISQEGDFLAIRRPAWTEISRLMMSQVGRIASIFVHGIDLCIAIPVRNKGDFVPILPRIEAALAAIGRQLVVGFQSAA